MEQLDREMQKRVWQRVQSREPVQMPEMPGETLKSLLLTARENHAAYTHLQKQMGPNHRDMVNRLRQGSQRTIACLQGICRLRGETVKSFRMDAGREDTRRALEKCYHRERKLCAAWEQRVVDPEFGMVFEKLGHLTREHCAILMELLGNLE